MAPTTTDREVELRTSLLGILHDRTLGMDSAADIAGAISSVMTLVHTIASEFATVSNRVHSSRLWRRLPAELKLETAHCLPRGQRAWLLGVSSDIRSLLLSDTSLWTTVALPRIRLDKADQVQCMQTLIARSGRRPVDVDCIVECANPTPRPDPLRDAVLSVLGRARTLVLHPSYFQAGPPSFWTTPTPLLQKLTITDGTDRSTLALQSSWPAKDTPLLRHLKLDRVYPSPPPLQPFQSVVDLEVTMGCPSGGDDWNHFFAWFPHLQHLLLHVNESGQPPAIPSPPDSLRHVTLRDGNYCKSPELVVRTWVAPHVQKLEIYSSERTAVHHAAQCLKRSDEGPWSVSFHSLCCSENGWSAVTVLRGQSVSVVVKSGTQLHHQTSQVGQAVRCGTLGDMRDVFLSGPSVPALFFDSPTLPMLRTLTVLGDEWNDLFRQYREDPKLHAPALEELVVDLRYTASRLDRVPRFVACIDAGRRLRQITIRLPASLDRQSPVTAQVSKELAEVADQVQFEYLPFVRHHEYPCYWYRARAD